MLNKMIVKMIPIVPKSIVYMFAKKYIAGPTLSDAVRVTKELMAEGGMSTIDVLGEFVDSKDRALHEKEQAIEVLDTIKDNNLKSYLSVKPTSLGLGIDLDFAYNNISQIVNYSKNKGISVRLDMENSPYTTKTLDMYQKLRDNNFDNIGFVIQAYMKRSMDDLKRFKEYKPSVRVCKGIYVESEEIAYKDFKDIQDNYKKLLRYMLENNFYSAIATHDEELINFARKLLSELDIQKDSFEFQMLLGVKDKLRKELIDAGYPMRVYVPFGEDWYGYSTRRLKENPKMAGHIVKSIFGMG